MPLATHPNRTLPVWLAVDADRPEPERPVFLCRFLSKVDTDTLVDEYASVRTALRAAVVDNAEDAFNAAHKRLEALLGRCVAGWRNMTAPADGKPLDFAPDGFARVMDTAEMLELAEAALYRTQMSEVDAKKSPPSASSAESSSAPDAAEGSAARTS